MAEPAVKNGKTRAQLDAQLGRINTAIERAYTQGDGSWDEHRRLQRRWFNATDAYGRLSGDDKLIRSFSDYRPETRGFTSFDEMRRVEKHFGLADRDLNSLHALRNNIVQTWINASNADRDNGLTEWMQSITAVIDNEIQRRYHRL